MVARPGMTNEEYNQMLKDQKAAKQRGNKVKLRKDHVSWASVAQEVYGDQRWAEELARMNPDVRFFSRAMTLKLPSKDKNPFISKSFLEGTSPYSLPGSDQMPLTTTAIDGTRTAAATATAAGPQPGFAQQRQPTGAYLDKPQQGLAGMERLPLEQSDVYAVLYRGMLPGTVDRTEQEGFDRDYLANLGRRTGHVAGQSPAAADKSAQKGYGKGEKPKSNEGYYPGANLARTLLTSAAIRHPQATAVAAKAIDAYLKYKYPPRREGGYRPFQNVPEDFYKPFQNLPRMNPRLRDVPDALYGGLQDLTGEYGVNLPDAQFERVKSRQKPGPDLSNIERDPRYDFQAPAYQYSEEIVTQFMREHPEILEGDFSNVDLDQLAVLMNYGYVDVYSGTSAASTGATGGAAAAGYYGRGRGGGGGGTRYYGGGGGTRYGSSYQRGEPVYIGLVKWRI